MVHANEKDSFEDDPTDAAKAKLKQSGKTLVKTEEREEGSVEGSAYMIYALCQSWRLMGGISVVRRLGVWPC